MIPRSRNQRTRLCGLRPAPFAALTCTWSEGPCRAWFRGLFWAMRAVVFRGVGDIRLERVHDPKIQKSTDAIVRLTASAICGTDLHMVRGTMPGMVPGTIL